MSVLRPFMIVWRLAVDAPPPDARPRIWFARYQGGRAIAAFSRRLEPARVP